MAQSLLNLKQVVKLAHTNSRLKIKLKQSVLAVRRRAWGPLVSCLKLPGHPEACPDTVYLLEKSLALDGRRRHHVSIFRSVALLGNRPAHHPKRALTFSP